MQLRALLALSLLSIVAFTAARPYTDTNAADVLEDFVSLITTPGACQKLNDRLTGTWLVASGDPSMPKPRVLRAKDHTVQQYCEQFNSPNGYLLMAPIPSLQNDSFLSDQYATWNGATSYSNLTGLGSTVCGVLWGDSYAASAIDIAAGTVGNIIETYDEAAFLQRYIRTCTSSKTSTPLDLSYVAKWNPQQDQLIQTALEFIELFVLRECDGSVALTTPSFTFTDGNATFTRTEFSAYCGDASSAYTYLPLSTVRMDNVVVVADYFSRTVVDPTTHLSCAVLAQESLSVEFGMYDGKLLVNKLTSTYDYEALAKRAYDACHTHF